MKTKTKNGGGYVAATPQATGKDANEGPLIDFASDMKKELPSKNQNQGRNSVKRTETDSSNDAFFDAYE